MILFKNAYVLRPGFMQHTYKERLMLSSSRWSLTVQMPGKVKVYKTKWSDMCRHMNDEVE